MPFDAARLEATGPPRVVIEDVMHAERGNMILLNNGAAQFSISNTGSLAYVAGGMNPMPAYSLVWVDRGGKTEPVPLPPASYAWPRFSPDGTRLLYALDEVPWGVRGARGVARGDHAGGEGNRSQAASLCCTGIDTPKTSG